MAKKKKRKRQRVETYFLGRGRKRALLIGINYTGTANELSGMTKLQKKKEMTN